MASLRRFLIGRTRRILLRHPVRGYRRDRVQVQLPGIEQTILDGALTQEDIQFRLGRFVIRVDEQMPQPQAERAQEIPSQEGQVEHKEGTLFPAGEHGAELAGARPFELRIVRQQVFDKCILVQLDKIRDEQQKTDDHQQRHHVGAADHSHQTDGHQRDQNIEP